MYFALLLLSLSFASFLGFCHSKAVCFLLLPLLLCSSQMLRQAMTSYLNSLGNNICQTRYGLSETKSPLLSSVVDGILGTLQSLTTQVIQKTDLKSINIIEVGDSENSSSSSCYLTTGPQCFNSNKEKLYKRRKSSVSHFDSLFCPCMLLT